MTSAYLLLIILGIWAVLVFPVWVRDRRAASDLHVKRFQEAMGRLAGGDGRIEAREPHVAAGGVPRAGFVAAERRRLLKQRRIAFSITALTFPIALAVEFATTLSSVIWTAPALASVTYVVFARHTIRRTRALRRQVSGAAQDAAPVRESARPAGQRPAQVEQPAPAPRERKPAERAKFGVLWTALQKRAIQRLTETAPQLDTEATPAWQPAEPVVETGREWVAPEIVLPTYTQLPAATEVPREIDRVAGGWGGEQMVEAARAQQGLASLVSQAEAVVAAAEAVEAAPIAKFEGDDTTELPRIVGA